MSEVVKPAEAEAERIRILALADAERTRIQAEAAASNNRVALDQLLINQLPLIVKEAAAGLAGANVSVLNGADGLGEIAAGLVSQGMTILDAVRKGMPGQAAGRHRQRAGGERPGGAGQPGRFGPRLVASAGGPDGKSVDLLTSWPVRHERRHRWLGSQSWQPRPRPSSPRTGPQQNERPRHRPPIAARWRWPRCTTC